MTPRQWLRRHDPADHLAVPADDVAVWLTGQSSFRHSGLSAAQDALLDVLAADGWSTVRAGLPWTATAVRSPYRSEPLPVASARNAAQWLAARTDPTFGDDVARHLGPVLERTRRRLLVLCGSAGAELLTVGLRRLDPDVARPSTTVLALGPVGSLPADVAVHVVRGRTDLLSRWGCRRPSDTVVPGGHLDYAASPDVRRVLLEVARAARRSHP
nr:hypothetical protein [uncultured Actinotalea sp.]